MAVDIVTALIGFFGVCLTLASTAWAQRRAEANARLASQKSLLAGLVGELKSNYATLAPYRSVLDELCCANGNGARLVALKFGSSVSTNIFDANLQNIGLLNSREVEKLSYAYSYLKMFEAFVLRLEQSSGAHPEGKRQTHQPFTLLQFDDVKQVLRFRLNLNECLDVMSDAIDVVGEETSGSDLSPGQNSPAGDRYSSRPWALSLA